MTDTEDFPIQYETFTIPKGGTRTFERSASSAQINELASALAKAQAKFTPAAAAPAEGGRLNRPAYHCFLPSNLEQQPPVVQFWLAWGAVWAVLGPLLCVALWLDWIRL